MVWTFFGALGIMMVTGLLLEIVANFDKRKQIEDWDLSGAEGQSPRWVVPLRRTIILLGVAAAVYLVYDGYQDLITSIPPELRGVCPPQPIDRPKVC